MNHEHAEHTLETIRTLMARSQRYEHISGYSGLVAGSAVLAGCGLLRSGWTPVSFVTVWSAVFAVAFIAHSLLTFARARQRDEPVWSRQARTVLYAVLPCLLASLALSVAVARLSRYELLPALWLALYGCGTLATSFFAPRSILLLGLSCLALGTASLLVWPDWPLLTMAVGFGLTHLVFGAGVLISEWRADREAAFWTEVTRLAEEEP